MNLQITTQLQQNTNSESIENMIQNEDSLTINKNQETNDNETST